MQTINARDELCHPSYTSLDSRLREDVIILNSIKKPGKTPKRVGLDGSQYMRRKQKRVEFLRVGVCDPILDKRLKILFNMSLPM